MYGVITPLLLFSAFLLLLLVTLSVPIIKSIYLFKLTAHVTAILDSGLTGSVRFGVWGFCYSAADTILGVKNKFTGTCSKAALGYTFNSDIARALHVQGDENAINKTLTAVLVLHPIACGLTFLALLASLFMLHRVGTARLASLATLALGMLAALLTTVVFLIDVILVAIVRTRVHHDSDGLLTLTWGNAVWMALGATVAMWLAVIGATCGIFQIRRARRTSKF